MIDCPVQSSPYQRNVDLQKGRMQALIHGNYFIVAAGQIRSLQKISYVSYFNFHGWFGDRCCGVSRRTSSIGAHILV